MRWSDDRILTTHAGSLPRPPTLVRLYARRAAGEAVDAAELDAAGREALRQIVPKQIEAGIDVGNNGEQQREGFFLYVQRRMSGFGGSWQRRQRGDVARYPIFEQMLQEQQAGRTAVSNFLPPKAIGEVCYLDPAAVEAECEDFRRVLDAAEGGFVEPFLTAPSPGIVAAAMQNEYYDTEEAYLAALADALRDRVRLHVCWGNYEGPHDLDVPLAEILPIIRQAQVGGFVFPFANPRHAHEYHCFDGGRALADDQILVAGVIDTLTNFVEHPEVVAERLERVAH